MPRWLPIRLRFFPVEPRKDSPFLLITTCILMAGVVMAAFLTEASQLSTVRPDGSVAQPGASASGRLAGAGNTTI